MPNFYQLLSVEPTATAEEIKRAFRNEIARYHPDKVQHLGKEFQEIAASRAAALTEAYRTLMNEDLRAETIVCMHRRPRLHLRRPHPTDPRPHPGTRRRSPRARRWPIATSRRRRGLRASEEIAMISCARPRWTVFEPRCRPK